MEEVVAIEQGTATYGAWTFKIKSGRKSNVVDRYQLRELTIPPVLKMGDYFSMAANALRIWIV